MKWKKGSGVEWIGVEWRRKGCRRKREADRRGKELMQRIDENIHDTKIH